MTGLLDGVRRYWDNLTDRERILLAVTGGLALAILLVLPVYFFNSKISDLEEDNAQISATLRRLARSRDQLAAQRAAQMAADRRYGRRAPSLGSFLEAKAGEQEGLTISDVQHEPDREVDGFRIRHTRARFQGTGLRNAVLLLQELKNSRYPVSVERIHVDHHNSGDRYNVQLGILAFDREGEEPAQEEAPSAGSADATEGSGSRRAGPPAP